jgi:hypothetical protein
MPGFREQLQRRREARRARSERKRERRHEAVGNRERVDARSRGLGEVPGTKGDISGGFGGGSECADG